MLRHLGALGVASLKTRGILSQVRSWEREFVVVSKLTREQAAIISAYTGYLAGPFQDMHEYAEKKFGHSIWTHQFGSEEVSKKLRELSKEDFLSMSPESKDE
jgi:hypothetical protein